MKESNIAGKILLGLVDVVLTVVYAMQIGSNVYYWNPEITIVVALIMSIILFVFSFKSLTGIIARILFCIIWVMMAEYAIMYIPSLEQELSENDSLMWFVRFIVFFFAVLIHLSIYGFKIGFRIPGLDYDDEESDDDSYYGDSSDGDDSYYGDSSDEDDSYYGDSSDEDDSYYGDSDDEDDSYYGDSDDGDDGYYGDSDDEDDSYYDDSEDIEDIEDLEDSEDIEDLEDSDDDGYYEEQEDSRSEDGYYEDDEEYYDDVDESENQDDHDEYGDDFEDEYEDVGLDHEDYSDYEEEYEDDYGKPENIFDKMKRKIFEEAERQKTDRIEQEEKARSETESYSSNQDVVSRLFIGCNDRTTLVSRYRSLMKTFHPDSGSGDVEMAQMIQAKYKELLKKYDS